MNQSKFATHPIYVDYEAFTDGIIRHKRLKKNIGVIDSARYMKIGIYCKKKMKYYLSHRFIFECFRGVIPSGLVIDHINRDKLDNRLDNLRVVTQQENCLNSAPKIKSQQQRPVIGILDIDEKTFPSISSAGKYYDICRRSIKFVADGITAGAYSKRFRCLVSFLYP